MSTRKSMLKNKVVYTKKLFIVAVKYNNIIFLVTSFLYFNSYKFRSF